MPSLTAMSRESRDGGSAVWGMQDPRSWGLSHRVTSTRAPGASCCCRTASGPPGHQPLNRAGTTRRCPRHSPRDPPANPRVAFPALSPGYVG